MTSMARLARGKEKVRGHCGVSSCLLLVLSLSLVDAATAFVTPFSLRFLARPPSTTSRENSRGSSGVSLYAARKKKNSGSAGEGFGQNVQKKKEAAPAPVPEGSGGKEEERRGGTREEFTTPAAAGEFKAKMDEVGKSLQALADQVNAREGEGEVRIAWPRAGGAVKCAVKAGNPGWRGPLNWHSGR